MQVVGLGAGFHTQPQVWAVPWQQGLGDNVPWAVPPLRCPHRPCCLPSASSLLWQPACRWGATLPSLQGSKGTVLSPWQGPARCPCPVPATPAGHWGLWVRDEHMEQLPSTEGSAQSSAGTANPGWIWGWCWLNWADTEQGTPLERREQRLGFARVCRETKRSQLSGREAFFHGEK